LDGDRGAHKVSVEELRYLEERLGVIHARQRLGVERDHEAQIFGYGRNFFHPENSALFAFAVEWTLKLSGLYWRGARNAAKVELVDNVARFPNLPEVFSGYTVLQISDLHTDMSMPAMARTAELVAGLQYDLCVLTGDYRGPTFGPHDHSMAGVAMVVEALRGPVCGILGNHDTLLMVPALEKMGVHVLLNESFAIERGDARLHIAGVDDPHFYRADNIEKAAANIPSGEFAMLLAHSPEIYRQAAHAGFQMMLSGHTHGGQVCLPGGIPMTLSADLPRKLGSGPWRHHMLQGYTSRGAGTCLVPVRFNCPAEVTLHRLERGSETSQ
jgi:predicted MPP superfamily phosphohydrolase